MIALSLLVFSSKAQVKYVNATRAVPQVHKRWSPLSGTGLQHALATASRKHFDTRPVVKVTINPAPKPAVSGWPMGYFEMPGSKHPKLVARR